MSAPTPDEVLTWCPQCGSGVAIDEDGCCMMCGATATGDGALAAIEADRCAAAAERWSTSLLPLVHATRDGIASGRLGKHLEHGCLCSLHQLLDRFTVHPEHTEPQRCLSSWAQHRARECGCRQTARDGVPR